jgi:hypothetical protein
MLRIAPQERDEAYTPLEVRLKHWSARRLIIDSLCFGFVGR